MNGLRIFYRLRVLVLIDTCLDVKLQPVDSRMSRRVQRLCYTNYNGQYIIGECRRGRVVLYGESREFADLRCESVASHRRLCELLAVRRGTKAADRLLGVEFAFISTLENERPKTIDGFCGKTLSKCLLPFPFLLCDSDAWRKWLDMSYEGVFRSNIVSELLFGVALNRSMARSLIDRTAANRSGFSSATPHDARIRNLAWRLGVPIEKSWACSA